MKNSSPKNTTLRTPEQARAWFIAHGINISEWCREQGLNRYIVTDLLRGRIRGHRGHAHRAAIALGLKADPETLDASDQIAA